MHSQTAILFEIIRRNKTKQIEKPLDACIELQINSCKLEHKPIFII